MRQILGLSGNVYLYNRQLVYYLGGCFVHDNDVTDKAGRVEKLVRVVVQLSCYQNLVTRAPLHIKLLSLRGKSHRYFVMGEKAAEKLFEKPRSPPYEGLSRSEVEELRMEVEKQGEKLGARNRAGGCKWEEKSEGRWVEMGVSKTMLRKFGKGRK